MFHWINIVHCTMYGCLIFFRSVQSSKKVEVQAVLTLFLEAASGFYIQV